MGTEWIPNQRYFTSQSNAYSNVSGLPRHGSVTRSYTKPPRPRQNTGRNQSKSCRETDRSVSQRRRFNSTSGPRSHRREKQVIVRQQPAGWYQADHITRNLSLAPRLPTYEPLLTYSISAGDQARRRRRARRNRRSMSKWPGQNRFPSPSVFNSTLGLLRELPCARLHYDSFRRIFPTLPTRTMKEKKFRSEAAKQLPFAKYPDDQLQDVIDSISQSHTVTGTSTCKHSESSSWLKTKDPVAQPTTETSQVWQTEGDTLMTNEVSEASESEEEDRDELPEEDEGEGDGEEAETEGTIDGPPESHLGKSLSTDCTEPTTFEQLQPAASSQRQPNAHSTSSSNKPSTPISEDFLSLSDVENRLAAQHRTQETGPINHRTDVESLPYIDVDPDVPLAAYDDATKSGDIGARRLPNRSNRAMVQAKIELRASGLEPGVMTGLPPLGHPTRRSPTARSKSSPEPSGTERSAQKVNGTKDAPIPRAHATDSSARRMTGALPCTVCSQVAYPAERLEADGKVFHVACFRCDQCTTLLQRGAWNLRGKQYYCNPCHRRIALQTLRH